MTLEWFVGWLAGWLGPQEKHIVQIYIYIYISCDSHVLEGVLEGAGDLSAGRLRVDLHDHVPRGRRPGRQLVRLSPRYA